MIQRPARALLTCGLATLCVCVLNAQPLDVEIERAHDTASEQATADQLRRLLSQFDLTPWLFTRRILVDERAIPHSHPVLTVHTRHLREDNLLLSTFVHEELHWWLDAHQQQTAAAVTELRGRFPHLPVGAPDGADNEESSYSHLIVIYLEHQGDKSLLGDKQATDVMAFWKTDHYRVLYATVLDAEEGVGRIVARHGLTCCSLR